MGLKFNIEKELPKLHESTFAEQVLQFNEVENPELFLNHEENEHHFLTNPENLFGMEEAAALYLDSLKNGEEVGVLVDDDADGFSSAAAMIKIHKHLTGKDNLEIIFHDQKSHGLSGEIEKILSTKIDLLIVPDAGSNDFEQHKILFEKGIKLIILDHHEVDEEDFLLKTYEDRKGKFIPVNCQLDVNIETNKQLVGAGMVYKFAEMIELMTEEKIAHTIADIVAVGQIGDASDVSQYEIHHIVRKGLDNLHSLLLKEIFKENIEKGIPIAPINLSFKIIPFINAVTRVGTLEEKQMVLDAMSDKWKGDETVTIEKRRKNKITGKFNKVEESWTHYAIVMDAMTKIKNRQNKEVTKIEKIAGEICTTDGICIAVIPEDQIEYRSITGLIANKLVSKYQMPALMLVEDSKGNIAGSGRGYEKLFKSFREWCIDSGEFDLAQGHDNAFGVAINKDNMFNLRENLKENFDEIGEPIYDVHKLFENETNIDEIIMINDNQQVFGGSIQNPIFGYKNLKVNRNCVHQRGSVVTFFHGGLEFIAYKQDPGVIDNFMMEIGFEQYVIVDLVGSASRSDYGGKVKDQIVLDDFSIRRCEPEELEESAYDSNGELSF